MEQLQIFTADLPGVRWVVLSGEIDLFTAQRVRERVLAAAGNAPEVIVDLRGIGFCDLRGLNLVLEAQRRCVRRGERFRLLPSDAVRRAVALGGLEELELAEAAPDDALFRPSGAGVVNPKHEALLSSIGRVTDSIMSTSAHRGAVVEESRRLRREGEERRAAARAGGGRD